MVVTNLYDHSGANQAEEGSGSFDGSGGSWSDGDCPTTARPLGLAPPQFLMAALAVFMVATQLVFWLVRHCAHAILSRSKPPVVVQVRAFDLCRPL